MMEQETILFVDDEQAVLSAFQRQFRGTFRLEIANSGAAALDRMAKGGPIAVLVADMQMPLMNGAELLAEVQRRSPSTVRIMLTGNSDQGTAVRAVNEGQIFRFLSKPCSQADLTAALQAGLERHRAHELERDLLERTLNGAIHVLTDIIAALDPAAFQRASTLRSVVGRAGSALKMDGIWRVELAAMVLDLGVVTLPADVAQRHLRAGVLTSEERAITASIPQISARLIAHIPRLEEVARILESLSAPAATNEPLDTALLRVGSAYVRALARELGPSAALASMRASRMPYDTRVLDAIAEAVVLPDDAAGSAATLEVSLSELRPSLVLAAPIQLTDGRPLLSAGTMINSVTLERVRNHAKLNGVREPIRVYDPRPDATRRARSESLRPR